MNFAVIGKPLVVMLIGATFALGLGACSSDDDEPAASVPSATAQPTDGADDGRPGDGDAQDIDVAATFIGLPRAEAITLAESDGRVWRVGIEDGEPRDLTDDLRPGRVTFELEQGVVTGAKIEIAIDLEPSGPTTPPSGSFEDSDDTAAILAASVKQLLTVDHSFGVGSPPPFDDVRIADAVGGLALSDLQFKSVVAVVEATGATVEFTSDPRAMIEGLFDANQPGVAVVTVSAIRLEDGRAEVQMELWCGSLCGVYLTYEVVQVTDGTWEVTGPVGPIAIS